MAVASHTDIDVTLEDDEQLTNFKGVNIKKIIERIHGNGAEILDIRTISHDSDTAKSVLKSEATKQEGCTSVISLYYTDIHRNIGNNYTNAICYVKEVTSQQLQRKNLITGGSGGSKPQLHRIIAFVRHNVTYEPKDHITTNRQGIESTIDGLLGCYPRSKFYIGIASGPDATFAMKRRCQGDEYKIFHGINRMIAVFKTPDQDYCRRTEEYLIEIYRLKYPKRCLNRTRGGGGRNTTQRRSFVYLGLQNE